MENELVFRPLKEEDYETICKWWKWWRWPSLPKTALPDDGKGGFMIEKNNIPIVSGFLYISNSEMAMLEWVVSNPKYREKDRKDAIELLINCVEHNCRRMGFKHLITLGRNKHLIETHKKLGWQVDKKPSYEIIKNL
jgi:hypothetical protein